MNITYDYETKVIFVSDEDDNILKTYSDAEHYLADYPDRGADCVAIGWAEVPND